MNELWKTRVYTVGAMEYANGENWRNKVKSVLTPMGVTVFDPYHKPFVTSEAEDESARTQFAQWRQNGEYDKLAKAFKQIRSDDLRLCDISDFAIVQIIPNVASWGSAEELTTFVRMKKPIFLFVEGGKQKTPYWIFGQIPHKYIYNSVDEVLDTLKKIDSGEIAIDSERWRLLQKEIR